MNTRILIQSQLLATKFFVPVTSGPLISRPRLNALLAESLEYPLTLLSAPAGFGKTTLLSSWRPSFAGSTLLVAWVSLDEEDNDPRLFWTYVLSALDQQEPELFTPLLKSLQSPQAPPLRHVLTALCTLARSRSEHVVLILDDYYRITESEVHATLWYLLEHLPSQLHIILSTRTDPPLLLSVLRARQQVLEIRTDQLRCTAEETRAFFHEVVNITLADEIIQEVTARTEGWLVGLQLLGLSLHGQADPAKLLEEVSGDQRYILDYLTQEVLERQPRDVQAFLLSTCILERLNASLCDAVRGQGGSQHFLEWLEQANVFVVSLDSKREWYRYHALFVEALYCRLEQMHADLVPILHSRASLWYAQHDQSTEAIVHACSAHRWQWAADLIERKSLQLLALTWGVSDHQLATLQYWLEQLPVEVMGSRPRLCLTCSVLLCMVAPYSLLDAWLDAAKTLLTASLTMQSNEEVSSWMLAPQIRQEQENLLGEVIAWHAFLRSIWGDGQTTLALCQQALSLLPAKNAMARLPVAAAQVQTYYTSTVNDAVAAVESGLGGSVLSTAAGNIPFAIALMGLTALYMIGAGRLHEAHRLCQQARELGRKPEGNVLPDVGWVTTIQAEILREWNELKAALSLAEETLSLGQQGQSVVSLPYVFYEYVVLQRIFLSRKEMDAARSALQQVERTSMRISQPWSIHMHSFYTTIDRVRLWLACGELDHATRWAEELDLKERHGTPFAHEREEVARARILLAKKLPHLALQRLEPLLQRATTGQRWGHVIEIRLLQALAYQMCQEMPLALNALSEAIHLAEPEGYIRSFVDEGVPMKLLLSQLRKRDRGQRPIAYLDTLLAAFERERMERVQVGGSTKARTLLELLSEQERLVLALVAEGASNVEIAEELAIPVGTVKRHVSHLFAKLGAKNRVQVIRQARAFGLLAR